MVRRVRWAGLQPALGSPGCVPSRWGAVGPGRRGAPFPNSHKGALACDGWWPRGLAAPYVLMWPLSQRLGGEHVKYIAFHSFLFKREWKRRQITLMLVSIFSVWTFKTRCSNSSEGPWTRHVVIRLLMAWVPNKHQPWCLLGDKMKGTKVHGTCDEEGTLSRTPHSLAVMLPQLYAVSCQRSVTWLRLDVHLETELGADPVILAPRTNMVSPCSTCVTLGRPWKYARAEPGL